MRRNELSELPTLLTVEEAGRVLGLSRSAAYRAVSNGDLPTLRNGRRIYVLTFRLLAMLGIDTPEVRITCPRHRPSQASADSLPDLIDARPW